MANETDSLVKQGRDILRNLASSQGAAYRQYGESLEKYGSRQISAGELFKTAGDLYFQQAGHVTSSLFDLGSGVFRWMLDSVGVQITDQASTETRVARPKGRG